MLKEFTQKINNFFLKFGIRGKHISTDGHSEK